MKMLHVLCAAGILTVLVGSGYHLVDALSDEGLIRAARAGGKTYTATMYVAGMGGHFAVADIHIDPADQNQPITVTKLEKLDIGELSTHPTHDARIDQMDRNTMYWSTYKLDNWQDKAQGQGKLHVGKSDLSSGKVLVDVAVTPPERAGWTGANYCGSGQSANSFIPVSMADEGYLDIWDKKTMQLKHRVFFDDLGIKAGEITFAHGTNTPDMKKFLLTVNLTPNGFTKWTGNTRLIMLDMAELEKGKIKMLSQGIITGKPKDSSGGTITFRQYFSPDGRYLFQSGADRAFMIDAETLKVIDEITPLPGENHDIIPTPDNKFAVLALREKKKDFEGQNSVDGTLMLYDVEQRKVVGNTASVCFGCHNQEGIGKAILCGLDANWK
ncbi:hypothetical protein ACFL6N_01585 [Thermodesulfobacteriota bacterium]